MFCFLRLYGNYNQYERAGRLGVSESCFVHEVQQAANNTMSKQALAPNEAEGATNATIHEYGDLSELKGLSANKRRRK